ncbi:MAG: hypothetical protein CM1200mP18_20290 [Gammaproteobacteria bacterium]|nr:MAG: hypothetical protein CM1200mP18_20290 [Gammaproteobacteria bacterium]
MPYDRPGTPARRTGSVRAGSQRQLLPNHLGREIPISPINTPVQGPYPVHARAMDKRDIASFRQWHRRAARLAKQAGFDIVYVYAGHDITLLLEFLSHGSIRAVMSMAAVLKTGSDCFVSALKKCGTKW